ncbi:DNA replication complex GINS protein PSF2-like [Pomacea canaliculata]|uniref:DNA replication complex GINS protein PSF2-like n=1 Tax=Pomacea canaliculata TaxID=400727 RepID=UPI000D7397E9|nr:DNA replication complex GINS protein PSF2-like [Pomacea canaliculata]
MDPSEVEFLAEKENITIVPNFSLEKIHLISGDFGPFSPGLPTAVPLWMACSLKQRQKCRIVQPEWMDVEKLTEKKQEEMDSKFFTQMPSNYYLEISQLVLQCATDDISRADEVKILIKDIWDLRVAKLRSSIDMFVKSDATHAKLNHLTLMEINTVRPFLTAALNHMHSLHANLTSGSSLSQD